MKEEHIVSIKDGFDGGKPDNSQYPGHPSVEDWEYLVDQYFILFAIIMPDSKF